MLYLVFDRKTGALVSYNGSAMEFSFFQTNPVDLCLQFVDVDQSAGKTSIVVANVSTQKPVVTLATKITGDEDSVSDYTVAEAVESAFTWDATNQWFTGTIILNTSAMIAWLGANPSATGFIEVNLTTDGLDPQTVYQSQFTVKANAHVASFALPGGGNAGGNLPLVAGSNLTIVDNLVTVTGLAWVTVPDSILISINVPAYAGVITGNYVPGSATIAGFQFQLSGLPDNADYTFTYIPIF
jgi:hypothetical protein